MRLLRARTHDPSLPFEKRQGNAQEMRRMPRRTRGMEGQVPYQDTREDQDQDRLQPTAKVPSRTSGPATGTRTGRPDQAEPEDHTTDAESRSIPGEPTELEQVHDEEDPEEA